MSEPHEAFKINLNQNLWGLLVGLLALGTAERFQLCALFGFAFVLSAGMIVSVGVTTVAYTINYWKDKMQRSKAKTDK